MSDWKHTCPICEYDFEHCQCRFAGSAHPDREIRRRAVLDHLQYLYDDQIDHLRKVQDWWSTSGEGEYQKVVDDMREKKSAEYIMPKKCEICGSDNIAIRVLFDKGITRYVCLDCGENRSIAKAKNLEKRHNTTISNWAARVIKNHPFCVICGSKEELEAHHIIPVSHSKDFAYLDNNGITLCRRHHLLVHKRDDLK